jgi:myo-inositol-1(or 4)-monophosphatase
MALGTPGACVLNLPSLLPVALDAIAAASDEIRKSYARPIAVDSKGDRDLVSAVDLSVEGRLRDFLGQRTPEIGFLGEEGGSAGRSADIAWVLDPIDGTVNFVRGLPLCAVALALVDRGRPVLGVIDLPFLGSRYSAMANEGAYLNDVRLVVRSTETLSEAMVAIGDFAVGPDSEKRNRLRLQVVSEVASVALRVRMLGSAALDLAWLAEGKLDATIVLSNKPWDVAAGVIIAREAGATVTDIDGSDHDLSSTATLAAPPALISEVLALVRRSAAWSSTSTAIPRRP